MFTLTKLPFPYITISFFTHRGHTAQYMLEKYRGDCTWYLDVIVVTISISFPLPPPLAKHHESVCTNKKNIQIDMCPKTQGYLPNCNSVYFNKQFLSHELLD